MQLQAPAGEDYILRRQKRKNLDHPLAGLPKCELKTETPRRPHRRARLEGKQFISKARQKYCGILSDSGPTPRVNTLYVCRSWTTSQSAPRTFNRSLIILRSSRRTPDPPKFLQRKWHLQTPGSGPKSATFHALRCPTPFRWYSAPTLFFTRAHIAPNALDTFYSPLFLAA